MATIQTSSLTVESSLYPRRFVDKSRVSVYAAAMKMGARFPAIKTAQVNGKTLILDGVHRVEAKKRLHQLSVEAEDMGVMTSTQAFAEAVRLNAEHGKPLTKIERLAAYKRLLSDGLQISKVEGILSVKSEDIKKWYPGLMTSAITGQTVGRKFDHKLLFWRIRELKTLIKTGLNGDEEVNKRLQELLGSANRFRRMSPATVKRLEDFRDSLTLMINCHSPEVHRHLNELSELLEKSLPKP